ncbi:MAG: alkaline phosphatase family protein [Candidatus Thorarchaeota archaeon]
MPKRLLLIGIDQAIPYFIKKFYEEGLIPNIGHLIENGVICEAKPCAPCDTPTNWTTIATGATTAIHGATSFYMHIPGESIDYGLNYRSRTQLSQYCQAEYFWDVANRSGLTPFVFNYPAGWPSHFQKGVMSLFTWHIPKSFPIMLIPSSKYFFSHVSDVSSNRLEILEINHKNVNKRLTFKAVINVKSKEIKDQPLITAYLFDSMGNGYDSLKIPISTTQFEIIKENEWSCWIRTNVDTIYGYLPCLFKLKIISIDPNGRSLVLERSGLYNMKGWSTSEEFSNKLIRNVFKYDLPKKQKIEFMMYGKISRFLSSARRESLTIAEAIKYSQLAINWDVCFFHYHALDTVNNDSLAYLDKKFPFYSEKTESKALNNIEIAYKIVDELVDLLLKSCVDETTIIVFVSDHGAVPIWKIINIPLIFKNAGLTSYKFDENQKLYKINWRKTIAFPYLEPPFVWINLKNRDPNGIVKESELDEVIDRIIDTLYSLKDPITQKPLIQKVFKREEAEYLGLNGERIGDLIYFLKPPYGLFNGFLNSLNASTLTSDLLTKSDVYDSQKILGAHAYYLPSTEFGNFTVNGPLIMIGPGIKKGVALNSSVNLIDVAPTLAHLLNIPNPSSSQGRVLYDFLI